MTPNELSASLKRVERTARSANAAEIQSIAARAVVSIEDQWPADTGRSRAAWVSTHTATGATVDNPVSYASDVHGGLERTLVPSVLSSLEREWMAEVNEQLLPTFEGR